MRTFATIDELAAVVGETIGHSDWITVSQREIDLFADATGDHQWIHVDPERAKDGPFGRTIAHGFLTLSLLPRLWHDLYEVEGVKMGVNYGLNKVRFPSPLPVDLRVRATSDLVSLDDLGNDTYQITLATVIEIEGATKPACVAESVVRYLF